MDLNISLSDVLARITGQTRLPPVTMSRRAIYDALHLNGFEYRDDPDMTTTLLAVSTCSGTAWGGAGKTKTWYVDPTEKKESKTHLYKLSGETGPNIIRTSPMITFREAEYEGKSRALYILIRNRVPQSQEMCGMLAFHGTYEANSDTLTARAISVAGEDRRGNKVMAPYDVTPNCAAIALTFMQMAYRDMADRRPINVFEMQRRASFATPGVS